MRICSVHRLVSLALLLALGAGRAGAQEPSVLDEPPEAPLPRYRVEIILFANTSVDATEEGFSYEAPPPVLADPGQRRFPVGFDPRVYADDPALNAAGLAGPDGGADSATNPDSRPDGGASGIDPAADARVDPNPSPGTEPDDDPFELIDPFGEFTGPNAASAQPAPFEFRRLRPDELQLNDAYARIDRLGAYRPLAHLGWVQDGLDESHAQAVDLASFGITNPRGTLTLTLERFLHLAVDIEYEAPQDAVATTAGDFDGSEGLSELALRPRFEMDVQRRARSGEVHYIDHPYFGLIFLITPAPEEETPADDTAVLSPAA
jgi:Peptidoglycan-binding protein, CsiV